MMEASSISLTPIIIGVLLIVGITVLVSGLRIVNQSEAVVIERLGKFNRVLESGINWIIPFIDKPRAITLRRYKAAGKDQVPIVENVSRIDRRETVLDFPDQPVVTSDNVNISVNGALYFQIIDPKKATYEIENFVQAVEVLAKTSLRSEIGKMELDKLFESRDEINMALQQTMDEVGDKWGVKVTRVEIQDIEMPQQVQEAMQQQMTAERKRRATVTEANGQKEAAIATAEGQKQAQILEAAGEKEATIARAEGDKKAAALRAEGEKEALQQVLEQLGESAQDKAVAFLFGLKYIEQLPNIAQKGERVFLPYEASALLSGFGSLNDLGRFLNADGKSGS